MKNALYVLRYAVTLNSEKIKPVALAIIELCLSEGISQSLENSFFIKTFYSNLLKVFRVNLKACLGLVFYLTATASSLSGKSEADFFGMVFIGNAQTKCFPATQYYI